MKRRTLAGFGAAFLCLSMLLALGAAVVTAEGDDGPPGMAPRGYVVVNGQTATSVPVVAKVEDPVTDWVEYGPCYTDAEGFFDFESCDILVEEPEYGLGYRVHFFVWGIEAVNGVVGSTGITWQPGTVTVGPEDDPLGIAKAHLVADIVLPFDGETVTTEDEFQVVANVSNTGYTDALSVTASMSTTVNVEVVAAPNDLGQVDVQGSEEFTGTTTFTWTVRCTDPGDALIQILPDGYDAESETLLSGFDPPNVEGDQVTVTATEDGCEPVQITDLRSSQPVVVGAPMAFTATVSGTPPVGYSWDFESDGIPDRQGLDLSTTSHTYGAAGVYTVTLQTGNCSATGPYMDVATLQVEVVEACQEPSITDLAADSPVVEGTAVHFTATVEGSEPITYGWDFGATGTGIGESTATPSFTYDSSGTFTVTLAVTNACGSDSRMRTVTVHPTAGPPAQIVLTAHPASLMVGHVASLTATVYDASASPLAGEVITFTTLDPLGAGSLSPTSDTTDGDGEALAAISSSVTGTKRITATAHNGVEGAVDVTFLPGASLYLPLVTLDYPGLPDLRVSDLSVAPSAVLAGQPVTVEVTVENYGPTAAGSFWVDLYLDPDPLPTGAKQPWDDLCVGAPEDCYGIAWHVEEGLEPGTSVVLSSLSISSGDDAHWPGYFTESGSHDFYAFADSRGGTGINGTVNEANEGLDNRLGPVQMMVEGTCCDILLDGGFETGEGWQLNNAGFDTQVVFEGLRSLRTGLLPGDCASDVQGCEGSPDAMGALATVPLVDSARMGLDLMVGSYSSGMQEVVLPENTAIRLSYWSYPICEMHDAGDVHYVVLEDEAGVDRWLRGDTRDTRTWEWYEHNLTAYAGQTVKLYFGSYNDGDAHRTAMFVDDAVLEVCDTAVE